LLGCRLRAEAVQRAKRGAVAAGPDGQADAGVLVPVVVVVAEDDCQGGTRNTTRKNEAAEAKEEEEEKEKKESGAMYKWE
jgi:alkanesulfonate monooxygenase SsuD/methylene tetrahydromethanopterin reductase-like flavin-dependent oxidoreductase (luciferase family)